MTIELTETHVRLIEHLLSAERKSHIKRLNDYGENLSESLHLKTINELRYLISKSLEASDA